MNFADRNRCLRCKSDFSLPLNVAEKDKNALADSGELNRSAFRFAWIFAVLAIVLLGVVFLNRRQAPQVLPEAASETVAAQAPVTADAEQPEQNAVAQNSQSEAAAKQILTGLKRFQNETESGLEFSEYNRKLNLLRVDLNNTLPSFVRHNPSDESFRQEVTAALQDYTAAEKWWKTTLANNSVFTDADRDERTQRSWASARTHLTNAEKMLVH